MPQGTSVPGFIYLFSHTEDQQFIANILVFNIKMHKSFINHFTKLKIFLKIYIKQQKVLIL